MEFLAHAGTFDVENYGDLLFPIIAARRLGDYPIRQFSPVGGPPVWSDCVPSTNLEGLIGHRVAGILIGGGNIIHPDRSTLQAYVREGVNLTGYADLWIGAALSVPGDVPVIWNAPGVPRLFETEFISVVRQALRRADYLSVRDEASRNCLLEVDRDLDVKIVPDTAWDLPDLWSSEELDEAFGRFMASRRASTDEPVFAVHLNARYLRDLPSKGVAERIDRIASILRARPILIAIGRCHDDHKLAQRIEPVLTSRPLLLDAPDSLIQVAAAISRSRYYVGSSMHGYITAASFGVPALVIAQRMIKFAGVVRDADAPETLCSSWDNAPDIVEKTDLSGLSARFRDARGRAVKQLDDHWRHVSQLLGRQVDETRGPVRAEDFYHYRSELLSATAQHHFRRSEELREINERLRSPNPAKRFLPRLLAKSRR